MESRFEMDVRMFLARRPFGYRNVPAEGLALFCEALTHDSYTNEHGDPSYERLEFLGDAVLEFVVCERVYRDTDLVEGPMTDFKQDKVANQRLSERVMAAGIPMEDVMRVGGGHKDPSGRAVLNDNMRADSFEAVLAAIYLTYGMDEVRRIVDEVVMADLPADAEHRRIGVIPHCLNTTVVRSTTHGSSRRHFRRRIFDAGVQGEASRGRHPVAEDGSGVLQFGGWREADRRCRR